MGTRHLIMVVQKKETKVAQYGQWDGYPGGQGVRILDFLRSKNMNDFRQAISETKVADEEQIKRLNEQIEKTKKFPKEFSRDTSAGILDMILDEGVRLVVSKEGFAKDSLFCEWAYVIDLDNDVLEVYTGFNKKPLSEGDRFYGDGKSDGEYYPVRLLGTVSFNELPTNEEFIKRFDGSEEEA